MEVLRIRLPFAMNNRVESHHILSIIGPMFERIPMSCRESLADICSY